MLSWIKKRWPHFMHSWLKKRRPQDDNIIRYCGYRGSTYDLTSSPRDCYVLKGECRIAFFENLSISGNTLHINHFAVDASIIGCGRAESIMRGYAQLVLVQAPNVDKITFDLHRASACSDLVRLADARHSFLQKLGATNIRRQQANQHIRVCAEWDREQWLKA